MIEVVEVRSGKDLNDFIRLPFTLYANDPFYVPQLTRELKKHFSDKNPFFDHATVRYFLARENDKIVGRVAAIINRRHIEFHHEKAGFFGFFESINKPEVAITLLNTVAGVLRKKGIEILRGPMNFSTNEECGFLAEGFDQSPILMTPYNHAYYNDLMEQCGLSKAKDLYAYILNTPEELPQKINRVAEIALKSGIRVRPIDMKNFHRDMQIFKVVYNSAWEKNWGFLPLTDKELVYLGDNLRPVVVPDMIVIAEKNNEPVGFLGLLPDFNFVLKHMNGSMNLLSMLKALYYSRKIKDLRMLLLGTKAEYRSRGVDALLFHEAFKGVKRGGYRRVEFSWILEENIPTQRLVEMIGGTHYKTFRIYEKRL